MLFQDLSCASMKIDPRPLEGYLEARGGHWSYGDAAWGIDNRGLAKSTERPCTYMDDI